MIHNHLVRAVVVHHNNFDIISETVRKLNLEGIGIHELLLVDNSTQDDELGVLSQLADAGVEILRTENLGYGAAVNNGIDWWLAREPETEFFLIATHEVAPETGAVKKLLEEVLADPSCGVAGPLLVTGHAGTTVWSSGGMLSDFLRIPFHRDHQVPRTLNHQIAPTTPVDWVDGAFVLLRRAALGNERFDRDFFMYVEEVHLQMKIAQNGWTVKIVPSAVVWQSSGGTPPFYAVRNIRLLHQKMGQPGLGRLAGMRGVLASVKTSLLAGRIRPLVQAMRGYWAGKTSTTMNPDFVEDRARFVLVNPLGGALAHYTESLRQNLQASGSTVLTLSIDEPSMSGKPRLVWLLSYWRALREARNIAGRNGEVMSLWPTLGYWDLLLVRILGGPSAAVVIHDPEPLVRAVGHSLLERKIIKRFKLARTVLHSATASSAYAILGFGNGSHLLPHPIRLPRLSPQEIQERPCVRVLGQYKNDRDIEALLQIADEYSKSADLEITGRRWPAIAGWSSDPRFVSETELDDLIATASVVVIPYAKFFQSGIAIRCAELGTPVVGPSGSSLAELVGSSSMLLADPGISNSWTRAVSHAIAEGPKEFMVCVSDYYDRCILSWAEYAASRTEQP